MIMDMKYLIKEVVVVFILLYMVNVLLFDFNIFVPINIFTLVYSLIFKVPGIISLTLISYVVM